jgi:hypothetical protein
MKYLIPICLVVIVVMLSGCITPPPSNYNKIYIYPEVKTTYTDDMQNFSIRCDAVDSINGFETSFTFNQSKIQIVNWEWADYFPELPESFRSIPNIDNVNGIVTNIYTLSLSSSGIKTSSAVIRFTYVTDESGICNINLYDTHIYNSTIELSSEITSGTIYITG